MKQRIFRYLAPLAVMFLLWFYLWPGKTRIVNYHGHELYRGVYNAVIITYNDRVIHPGHCRIEITGGKYKIEKDRLYLYSAQNEVHLRISDFWGRHLYNDKFSFGQILTPDLAFDGHILLTGGALPRSFFDEAKGLAIPSRFDILDTLRIVDYCVTLQMGNESRELRIKGGLITDELHEYFHRLKPNDRVMFHHIHFSSIEKPANDEYKFFNLEVSGLHGRNDYFALVRKYEYKDTSRLLTYPDDSLESLYHLALRSAEDTLPTFSFTNCHSYSDTCRIEVYAIDGQRSGLTRIYEYLNDDRARIRWYYHDILLSDIRTRHDEWSGPFALYYRDGRKRMEGSFKLDSQTDSIRAYPGDNDEVRSMNNTPKTTYQSKAIGVWHFYSADGKETDRHYIDGAEMK